MTRISYELLAYQVDQLYAVEFDDSEAEAITKHCEYIAEFIKSCGWDEESYMLELMKRALAQAETN